MRTRVAVKIVQPSMRISSIGCSKDSLIATSEPIRAQSDAVELGFAGDAREVE